MLIDSQTQTHAENRRETCLHIYHTDTHTQTPTHTNLHTEAVTHRNPHKIVYTQKFYTQKLLHTEACTPEHK